MASERALRALVAPQEFKESLTAIEAAAAIAHGIRAAQPAWAIDELPMSDGGPGFVATLARATGGSLRPVATRDALGRAREAEVLEIPATGTVVIEAAMANGLAQIAPEERQPLHAGTEGVGDLINAALDRAPRRIILGVGGSATSDGGSGMARALGARLRDGGGNDIAPGIAPLASLERIDWQRPAAIAGAEVLVATDVTNPLVGPEGSAAVFGPQKGATEADVEEIEAALQRYARVVQRSLGVEIAEIAGGGAAGGLAAGLVAFLGGRIVSGFDVVAEATDLPGRVHEADIIVAGEGSFDDQSRQGKTTGRLLDLAEAAGKPCVVFAGRADGDERANLRTLSELEPDPLRRMWDAAQLLQQLAARWARTASV